MTDFSDLLTATKAAVDPSTSAADLAQIAQAQPRLWPDIAAHPNAYPDLLAWLDSKGDVASKRAVATRLAASARPSVGHRSHRALVIGGLALVVVIGVAIVLAVVRPWYVKDSTGPTLTVDQFAAMLDNDGGIISPNLISDGSDATYATVLQFVEGNASSAQQYVVGTLEGPCYAVPDATWNEVIGFYGGGLDNAGDVLLTDSPGNAYTLAASLSGCFVHAMSGGAPADMVPTQSATSGGVWLFGVAKPSGSIDALDVGIAQYGNVIVLQYNDSETMWQDSWAKWNTNAATFRQAVDQAAKS